MRAERERSVVVHFMAGALLLALIVACGGSPEPAPTPGERAGEEAMGTQPEGFAVQPGARPAVAPTPQAGQALGSVEERRREIEQIPFEESDSKAAIAKLRSQLSDPELEVREAVVMALAEMESGESTEVLAQHARVERDGMLKIDMVDELIDRQAPQTLDTLLFLLGDTDSDVREAAADGLDELGDKRAIPALHDALRAESDEFVRDAILFALTSLDPDFDEDEYEYDEE
jgi:HEAT repeat protein